jgi:hypothetical protein
MAVNPQERIVDQFKAQGKAKNKPQGYLRARAACAFERAGPSEPVGRNTSGGRSSDLVVLALAKFDAGSDEFIV